MSRPIRFPSGIIGTAALWVSIFTFVPPLENAAQELEYRVKSAFLLNFTKFVDWPPESAGSDPSLAICIIGEDPFGATLDRMVQGEQVGGRRVVVRRFRSKPEPGCSLVFVSPDDNDPRPALAAMGRGVLAVGEGDRFLEQGGMIAFVIDAGHVRFDINQSAVRKAGLKLSSRLLAVARFVRD